MTELEKARAMKCFGGFVETVELDPDPNTKDKLQEEYNCAGCDSKEYCNKLADSLR